MAHRKNGNCFLFAWDEKTGKVIEKCLKHGQPIGNCSKCRPCEACKPTPPTDNIKKETTRRRVIPIETTPTDIFTVDNIN